MQFILADFIHDNSIDDKDRKKLNETDFGTELQEVLCKWINLGFNR